MDALASVLVAAGVRRRRRRRKASLSDRGVEGDDGLRETVTGGQERSREVEDGRSGQEEAAPRVVVQVKEVTTRLMAWTELPPWQQTGSELIHTGYRTASGSVVECLRSWTYVHNETVNIFSHVLGAILFLALPLYVFVATVPPRRAVASTADVVVCTTYLVGVGVCFVLSATFHTLMSHSQRLYLIGMRLDFAGILILMWGATVPLIFYSFPRHHLLRAAYWAGTSVLAALCTAVSLFPRFNGPALGHARAVLFASFGGGSFLLPVAHGMLLYGVREQARRVALEWIAATAGFNGLAVGVYVLKFPERWFPGRYDLFGASHQLMHIFVLVAAVAYAVAVVEAFDFRHGVAQAS